MASIRRQGQIYEIRECRMTERGPRQFALARFRTVLTPEALEEAARRARRPFDPRQVVAAARARGIAVTPYRRNAAARRLLADLRAGHPLEPSLVAQLRRALDGMPECTLPEHLSDAADWIGRSEAARGKALRGLLRTAGRTLRSRGAKRTLPQKAFPHFSSERPEREAS